MGRECCCGSHSRTRETLQMSCSLAAGVRYRVQDHDHCVCMMYVIVTYTRSSRGPAGSSDDVVSGHSRGQGQVTHS